MASSPVEPDRGPAVGRRRARGRSGRSRRRRALLACCSSCSVPLVGAGRRRPARVGCGLRGQDPPRRPRRATRTCPGWTGRRPTAALAAAYPYQDGRVVVRTPDGDVVDRLRRLSAAGRTWTRWSTEAMASGRAGTRLDRAVAQVRQALDGTVLEPRAVFDEAALAAAVTSAVTARSSATPVDATIAMGPDGPVTTPARDGSRRWTRPPSSPPPSRASPARTLPRGGRRRSRRGRSRRPSRTTAVALARLFAARASSTTWSSRGARRRGRSTRTRSAAGSGSRPARTARSPRCTDPTRRRPSWPRRPRPSRGSPSTPRSSRPAGARRSAWSRAATAARWTSRRPSPGSRRSFEARGHRPPAGEGRASPWRRSAPG